MTECPICRTLAEAAQREGKAGYVACPTCIARDRAREARPMSRQVLYVAAPLRPTEEEIRLHPAWREWEMEHGLRRGLDDSCEPHIQTFEVYDLTGDRAYMPSDFPSYGGPIIPGSDAPCTFARWAAPMRKAQ